MAIEQGASDAVVGKLLEHYYEINEGIGVNKPPELYGAFPTDPYSHTPSGKGAQQPGMTGQVKEDILSRFGELGVFVSEGKIYFDPCLLRKAEFLTEAEQFNYVDVARNKQQIHIPADAMCFTYGQVPVVYRISDADGLEVHKSDGSTENFNALSLNKEISERVFNRTGEITRIDVHIRPEHLK